MSVTITLQKTDGTVISSFLAEDHQSIAQMTKKQGINFPISCGVGLCGICKCKILAGHEYIQIDKISLPIKPLERDENWNFTEVFACVWGVSSEAIKDTEHHEIILEKDII